VLTELSGDSEFALVLPHWLPKRLPWGSAPLGAEPAVRSALAVISEHEALLPHELLDALALDEPFRSWLASEVWRGTVASAVYVSLRVPGVHRLGTGFGLSFSTTKRHGQTLRRVGLERLLAALERVADHAKTVSLDANMWFGVE